MKQAIFPALFLALVSVGCGHRTDTVVTGADGSQVTVHQDNGGTAQIEATDKNGTKVTENFSPSGYSATDNKGDSSQIGTGVVTEDSLGLPFYPGSEEAKSGLNMVTDSPTGKAVASSRTTKDTPDQVAAFYKDKLTGVSNSSTNSGDTTMVMVSGKLATGADASIIASKKGSDDTAVTVTVSTKKSKS